MIDYIDRIVANGKQEDMECLSEMLVELLEDVKETKPVIYKKYKTKLKGMAYDYKVDRELAQEIVQEMRPIGQYWTIEEIATAIGNDMHSVEEMYVVMNSLVNDYKDILGVENPEIYIKMAHAWLDDVDAKEHKFWNYFVKN